MSFVHKHTLMILLIRAMGNTVVPFCGGATGRDPRRVPPDFKSGAVTFVSAIVRSVDSTVFSVSAWVFILSLMIVWRCLPRRSHRQRAPQESAVRRGNALKEIGPSSRPHSKKTLHHRLVLANARRPGNIILHIECVCCSRCGSGTLSCILARWMGTRMVKKITGCEILSLGRYVTFSSLRKSLMTL